MSKKYIMAFDQGTTSSRCILFDGEGRIAGVAQKEFEQIYPQPGWVEHRPMDIWSSQVSVAIEALAKVGATADEVAAIGITNQRETTILWNRKTGRPVGNAIVWQCRRTADRIERLEQDGMVETIKEKTGLIPDAYFSATKIAWILDNVPGVRAAAERGEIAFGTVDTWLIWNLTGGKVHATDYTNASRTMLFNIHDLKWDEELLAYFHIPASILPDKVLPSGSVYGYTTEDSVVGGGIMIGGVAGDQQAALFGQKCFTPGSLKNTYGTGCFLLMNTGKHAVQSRYGLLTTIAAGTDEKPDYALEGSVFVGGAVVQWLRDSMELIQNAAESERVAAGAAEDCDGVYVVPAFTGLGAPYWDSNARGMVVGLTRGAGREDVVRASLESIAYQTQDVIEAMQKDSGMELDRLLVDGGASANAFLMQFQANVSDVDVVRPACIESTALGAAYLAGLTAGFYTRDQMGQNSGQATTFAPSISHEKRARMRKGWRRAVRAALAWANDAE